MAILKELLLSRQHLLQDALFSGALENITSNKDLGKIDDQCKGSKFTKLDNVHFVYTHNSQVCTCTVNSLLWDETFRYSGQLLSLSLKRVYYQYATTTNSRPPSKAPETKVSAIEEVDCACVCTENRQNVY